MDQLAGFVLVRAQERCEYEKVRHLQPMTGLRDTTDGGTRDALYELNRVSHSHTRWNAIAERFCLIELGELDPPFRVRNFHQVRRPPRQILRLNQKVTVDRFHH